MWLLKRLAALKKYFKYFVPVDALWVFQELARPHQHKIKGIKVLSHLKDCFEKRAPGCPAYTRLWELFSQV
jgi:hypothetical protein